MAALGGWTVVAEADQHVARPLEVGLVAGEGQVEVRAADLRLEGRRRALGDDHALVDDADAVGELVGLLEVLRGQEDRRAGGLEAADLLPEREAADGVQSRRGLV